MVVIGGVDKVASVLVEKVEDAFSGGLVADAHEVLPVIALEQENKDSEIDIATYQAFPKFIAPRQMGLTRTDALGAKRR